MSSLINHKSVLPIRPHSILLIDQRSTPQLRRSLRGREACAQHSPSQSTASLIFCTVPKTISAFRLSASLLMNWLSIGSWADSHIYTSEHHACIALGSTQAAQAQPIKILRTTTDITPQQYISKETVPTTIPNVTQLVAVQQQH